MNSTTLAPPLSRRWTLEGIEAIFFASGAAALTYQVTWQRLLFAAYGVDVESTTIIVSAFMLGLGLGALLGGWVADRFRMQILLVFAGLEGVLALLGAASPFALAWLGEATVGIGKGQLALLSFALLLVPTSLMGATLPLLVTYFDGFLRCVGASVGRLYFVNTVGAAAGAALTGFVLLDYLEIRQVVWAAAVCNMVSGLAALFVARSAR
jgi:predicted membrane-bound spermidine synthase